MTGPYICILSHPAQKALDRLANKELDAIQAAIDELSLARQDASNTKKLKGQENLYRKRVGDFRIIFEVRHGQQQVDILVVADRKDAYRP